MILDMLTLLSGSLPAGTAVLCVGGKVFKKRILRRQPTLTLLPPLPSDTSHPPRLQKFMTVYEFFFLFSSAFSG